MSEATPQLPAVAAPFSEATREEQPFLLDEKFWPIRQDLVELVKEKSFLHTGKIVGKDEELCRAVCKDLVVQLSGRKIAKKYSISRHTVLAIEKLMRERGELEPLKKQVMGQLDDIIYLGLERIKDALLADEISPGQLPIPMAALIDKKGQLEAGMVPGTDRTVREVTEAEIVDEFARMKRAKVITVDSQSVGTEANKAIPAGLPALDAGSDAGTAAPAADPGPVQEPAVEGGEGGRAPRASGGDVGSTPGKFGS
jgi:hypothetical protein